MIEAGCYDLRVVCDGPHFYPDSKIRRPYIDSTIDAPHTLALAKRELRERGWIFKRDGRTYCSKQCEKAE